MRAVKTCSPPLLPQTPLATESPPDCNSMPIDVAAFRKPVPLGTVIAAAVAGFIGWCL